MKAEQIAILIGVASRPLQGDRATLRLCMERLEPPCKQSPARSDRLRKRTSDALGHLIASEFPMRSPVGERSDPLF